MIASLPMYDRPETAAANDRLWSAIARHLQKEGVDAPAALDRDMGLWEAWQSPDLLLSQTCGLPFRARLHPTVTLVATPVCDLAGVPPGHYHSVLVARRDDPREDLAAFDGATLAVNDPLSQSGWAAPLAEAAALGIAFGSLRLTGAHRASAAAVAEGAADLAAIDGVSWAMIRRWDAPAEGLREIATTRPTPALPWITARADLAPLLARALAVAIAGLPAEDRRRLCLAGAMRLPPEAYLAVPIPPPCAAEPA
jgi:ABC-type phosphate/phosphonate transport system substrate-binding protein